MTALIGVLCKDGVVIGADSSMTFAQGNNRTIEQPAEKISVIDNHIILAGTGQVGLGQRFEKIVQDAWSHSKFSGHHIDCAKRLTKTVLDDFIETKVIREQYGALLAFPISGKPYLCEFAITDLQPEFKTEKMWYCSMGCAQPITDTFLAFMRDIFWTDGPPNIADGVFSVLWTLEMAIQINPGGVNGPIRIATLSGSKGNVSAKLLTDSELQEHYQALEDMKTSMRKIADSHNQEISENKIPAF
ncbi:MAG: hypothetical protein AB2L12_15420 [Smithellaceae bacterium]